MKRFYSILAGFTLLSLPILALAVQSVEVSSNASRYQIQAGAISVELARFTVATPEAMRISSIAISSNSNINSFSNLGLFDVETGAIMAGPAEIAAGGVINFTDTIIIPEGTKTYALKGRVTSSFVSPRAVNFLTNPSSDWLAVWQASGQAVTFTTRGAVKIGTVVIR